MKKELGIIDRFCDSVMMAVGTLVEMKGLK